MKNHNQAKPPNSNGMQIMSKMAQLSRRQLVMALSIPPIVASGVVGAIASTDVELIELGREFNKITAQLDAAIDDPTKDLSYAVLNRLSQTVEKILATQSQTIEGLRVKAQAACWARLGDLDPRDETNGGDMALSIVRDLIRLYDPHLERPGALTELVQDIEQGASKPAPTDQPLS